MERACMAVSVMGAFMSTDKDWFTSTVPRLQPATVSLRSASARLGSKRLEDQQVDPMRFWTPAPHDVVVDPGESQG